MICSGIRFYPSVRLERLRKTMGFFFLNYAVLGPKFATPPFRKWGRNVVRSIAAFAQKRRHSSIYLTVTTNTDVIINIIITIIRHQLGLDRPLSALLNSLFRRLPNRLRPFGLWSTTRLPVPSHSSIAFPSSPEETLQNTPVQRLTSGSPTTGLPSSRLVTRPRELNIIFGDFVPSYVPQ